LNNLRSTLIEGLIVCCCAFLFSSFTELIIFQLAERTSPKVDRRLSPRFRKLTQTFRPSYPKSYRGEKVRNLASIFFSFVASEWPWFRNKTIYLQSNISYLKQSHKTPISGLISLFSLFPYLSIFGTLKASVKKAGKIDKILKLQ